MQRKGVRGQEKLFADDLPRVGGRSASISKDVLELTVKLQSEGAGDARESQVAH